MFDDGGEHWQPVLHNVENDHFNHLFDFAPLPHKGRFFLTGEAGLLLIADVHERRTPLFEHVLHVAGRVSSERGRVRQRAYPRIRQLEDLTHPCHVAAGGTEHVMEQRVERCVIGIVSGRQYDRCVPRLVPDDEKTPEVFVVQKDQRANGP